MADDLRAEQDSMGTIMVPAQAYYGAQTQRAVENFPVSGWRLPPAMIHAMGRVKSACGIANLGTAPLEKSPPGHPGFAREKEIDALCPRQLAKGSGASSSKCIPIFICNVSLTWEIKGA